MEPFPGFLSLAQWLVFLTSVAFILGARIPHAVLWTVAGLVMAAYAWIAVTMITLPGDASLFWRAGQAVWARTNPYLGTFVINPPPALIWYAAMAMIPQGPYLIFWRMLGTVAFGSVTFAAHGALGAEREDRPWRLPPVAVALLAAAVAISVSTREGLVVMNSTFTTTLCLVAAIACRDRVRPVAAGIFLALASVKITTLLPFLLLFFRGKDRNTWIAMIAAGLLITLLVIPPSGLPAALQTNLTSIREEGGAGGMSDYAFENPLSTNLVAFDHAIYHLGIRDRTWVKTGQMIVLISLGAWVAWQLYRSPELAHAPACAIVACYSALFLYHRIYDMAILAIPLVYCAGRGLREPGRVKWAYRLCAVGLLWVPHLRINVLDRLIPYARQPGILARLIEAVVLPQAVWIILGSLVLLVVAERYSLPAAPAPANGGAPALPASGAPGPAAS